MQEEPRFKSFFTPYWWALWMAFKAIARLSRMNSALYVSFARIPPTLAAARKTYWVARCEEPLRFRLVGEIYLNRCQRLGGGGICSGR
jgi:hypothetical protein